MIVFAVAGAVLVAVALAFLLRPLLRTPGGSAVRSAAQANLAVYRQQLNELEADARSGTLSADQHQAARRELERRLLDDVAAAHGEPQVVTRRSPRLALTVGALVPVAAVLLYAGLGSPDALRAKPAAEAAHGSAHGMDLEQIDVLAARLAARLGAHPDDAEGWALLARTYEVMGREAEAVAAYARADQASSVAPGISGKVAIAPKLARSLPPTDTVFIFARAADGPRMPLAMLTTQVKDLPTQFVLDDTASMIPGRKLSDVGRVVVTARVSRTGSAERQPGDVEGTSSPVAVGARDLRLTIDTVVR